MHEIILSVSIGVSTSTAQLIFSRLTIENRASSYAVPRIDIVDKEMICRSKIYFTPLHSATEIDAEAIKRIVREKYRAAGVTPGMLRTGAVIVTGETARKKNANEVLKALSGLTGDFVVATAGPDLESVLSTRGVGTNALSEEKRTAVASVDIDGETSSITVYEKGVLRGIYCLDIGGRLIKVENGRISHIFPKIQTLTVTSGISLVVGDRTCPERLYGVCRLMVARLTQALRLARADSHHAGLYASNGKPLPEQPTIIMVTYSDGVAGCIYQEMEGGVFRLGDIDVLLGEAIRTDPDLSQIERFTSVEAIRAIVIGARVHATRVGGSTIYYEQGTLPLKNVPILKVSEEDGASLETLKTSILNQMPLYMSEGKAEQLAIALTREKRTSFADIQALAATIVESTEEMISSKYPLAVIMENDIGKVLGNALNVLLKREKSVVYIGSIRTLNGGCIDISEPIVNGQVLPVVIKTLILNS